MARATKLDNSDVANAAWARRCRDWLTEEGTLSIGWADVVYHDGLPQLTSVATLLARNAGDLYSD